MPPAVELYVSLHNIYASNWESEEKDRVIAWAGFLQAHQQRCQHVLPQLDVSNWDDLLEGFIVCCQQGKLDGVASQQLRDLVQLGVPLKLRGKVWQFLLGAQHRKRSAVGYYSNLAQQALGPLQKKAAISATEYQCLHQQNAPDTLGEPAVQEPEATAPQASGPTLLESLTQIEKDVPRTFCDEQLLYYAGPCALRRVLAAYAIHNPVVSYCQGMNFMAGLLLLFMDEESAFWCLDNMVQQVLAGYHSLGSDMPNVDMTVFQNLLQQELPQLAHHLEGNDVDVTQHTVQWMFGAFVHILPMEVCLRVWDVAFLERSAAPLFRVMLALLQMFQGPLLSVHDCSDLHTMLRTAPTLTFDQATLLEIASVDYQHITPATLASRRADVVAESAAAEAAAAQAAAGDAQRPMRLQSRIRRDVLSYFQRGQDEGGKSSPSRSPPKSPKRSPRTRSSWVGMIGRCSPSPAVSDDTSDSEPTSPTAQPPSPGGPNGDATGATEALPSPTPLGQIPPGTTEAPPPTPLMQTPPGTTEALPSPNAIVQTPSLVQTMDSCSGCSNGNGVAKAVVSHSQSTAAVTNSDPSTSTLPALEHLSLSTSPEDGFVFADLSSERPAAQASTAALGAAARGGPGSELSTDESWEMLPGSPRGPLAAGAAVGSPTGMPSAESASTRDSNEMQAGASAVGDVAAAEATPSTDEDGDGWHDAPHWESLAHFSALAQQNLRVRMCPCSDGLSSSNQAEGGGARTVQTSSEGRRAPVFMALYEVAVDPTAAGTGERSPRDAPVALPPHLLGAAVAALGRLQGSWAAVVAEVEASQHGCVQLAPDFPLLQFVVDHRRNLASVAGGSCRLPPSEVCMLAVDMLLTLGMLAPVSCKALLDIVCRLAAKHLPLVGLLRGALLQSQLPAELGGTDARLRLLTGVFHSAQVAGLPAAQVAQRCGKFLGDCEDIAWLRIMELLSSYRGPAGELAEMLPYPMRLVLVTSIAWNYRGVRDGNCLLTTTGRVDEVREAVARGATHVRVLGVAYRILATKRHVGNNMNTWLQVEDWDRGDLLFDHLDLVIYQY